jgi:hypothetical protein
MIQTQFFILSLKQYNQVAIEAQQLGVSIDYYLSEFCAVEGDIVYCAE